MDGEKNCDWERLQECMKNSICETDVLAWQINRKIFPKIEDTSENAADGITQVSSSHDVLRYVGGVDISFVKENESIACVAVVVLELPSLNIVYSDQRKVDITIAYKAGFLAFKEAPHILMSLEILKQKSPDLFPQVILVDGNGILHHRGCGIACHLGISADVPCIGVAKNLLNVDGLERDDEYQKNVNDLKTPWDSFPLIGKSGKTLGLALKTTEKSTKPIFISVGHKISLDTAKWVVEQCCLYRIPEPTRQADILSRKYLRDLLPQ